jgi:CheY-like chemotaxis protein
MAIEKFLLVEDNPNFLAKAREALGEYRPIIASDYETALKSLRDTDAVITDLFYPYQIGSSDRTKGYEAVESIRRGMALPYIQETERRLAEKGILSSPELRASLEILGLHKRLYSSKEKYSEAIVQWLSVFKEEGIKELPKILEEMLIKKTVEEYIPKKFEGLRKYVEASPENQPLGYLIAEEAERQGKPFVIATSLRHSESPLIPILDSAGVRGWNLLEGKDGSKESLDFWKSAYNILKGGKQE